MIDSPQGGRYFVTALGPLGVSHAGRSLELGGPKQRLVLAILLAHRDHVVRSERLIDGLWGEQPPPTARKALQMHVSNLRRSLGEAFPLKTAPGGYLIQSAAIGYDVENFEVAVTEATGLLRTDPEVAATGLSSALELWYGPAFGDVADEIAVGAEIARLNQLRITALERRIDADLRVGRHAELVSELEALTIEYPYHERFREQQMLALYRSGRQTEALRVYDHTRSTLVDELGIEPSRPLQELHRQVLRQAPELDQLAEPGEPRFVFLATDLADSTSLWEADPEAMQAALSRHDDVLHSSVSAHGGSVFKGTGDGVYAVFGSATDAIDAAADAQRALSEVAWPTEHALRVRMAVDEGVATGRDGDFFGPAMNRVSRLMASAHGGQVVIPSSLANQSSVPTRDLGAVDYRGVGRVEVAQLEIAGQPGEFPDLHTERAPRELSRRAFGRSIRGYELREQLGIGASGLVFRAYQSSIGREVAIKIIRPELANRPGFVRRFEAEAQFVAQLEHPHIVPLYDFWRDPDGAYLVMQMLRGGSLADSLERSPWRPSAALRLLDQVGTAMDYAHRHGILHRDLKPANVLLDGDENAFLSDFGIATDHVDAVGMPVESSVAYVSPEELAGKPIGVAADMYGLTLLAFETLTGARPEPGGTPPSVNQVRTDLPAAIDRVIERGAHPDPEQRYPRVMDFLRDLRHACGVDLTAVSGGGTSPDVRNPFKGLRAFRETDSADFFGRDELVADLVDHVSSHRLTTVVGPSGSGKSSVVRAGVLPAIRRGEIGSCSNYVVTEMYPGTYPFEELASALQRVAVTPVVDIAAELLGDSRGLLRVAKQILPTDDTELVLVIDQFEELFSLTADIDERRRFLDSLVAVASDERSRIRIIATLRADFFDRPLEHAEFGAVLRQSLVAISAPHEHELATAIVEPARRSGLEFEPGLVARIVRDVAAEPGALPLLQYALTSLVDEREGRMLDTSNYERIGGVSGALARRAEDVYAGLSSTAQEAARELLLRLVRVDEHGDETRRRAGRPELSLLGFGENTIDSTVAAFGSLRLLTFDRDPVSRGQTVEVAHEALIRDWPRFQEWIADRRESMLTERRVELAIAEWLGAGRPDDLLVSGSRLEQFERWAADDTPAPSDDVAEFLGRSRLATDAASRRRTRRRAAILGIVATLAVGASGAAVLAWTQRDRALDSERSAVGAAATAVDQAQRANEAERRARDERDRANLERDRAFALADELEGEIRRADVATSEAIALADEATTREVAESARRLASLATTTIDDDADLAVLLAVESARRAEASGASMTEPLAALVATTSQHSLAGRFSAWDVPHTFIPVAAVAPDGSRVAVVESNTAAPGGRDLVVTTVETGATVTVDVSDPTSVAWHTNGDELLVGDAHGQLSFVDPASGTTTTTIDTGHDWARVWEFTADWILYQADDGSIDGLATMNLLDVSTQESIFSEPGVTYALLSPSGNHLFVAGTNGGNRIIELASGDAIATLPGDITLRRFDWNQRGDQLISIDAALTINRIDVPGLSSTGASVPPQSVLFPTQLTLSPDQRLLAVGDQDGTVFVLDAETLDIVDEKRAHDRPVKGFDWSDDGRLLVSIDDSRQVLAWRVMSTPPFPQNLWAGSSRYPIGHVVDRSGTRFVETRDSTEVTSVRIEQWNPESANDAFEQPTSAGPTVFATDPSSGNVMVAHRRLDGAGIVVRDVTIGTVRIDRESELDHPIALAPDGSILIAGISDGALFSSRGSLSPRISAIDTATGRELWSFEGFRSQSKFGVGSSAVFSPSGEIVLVATGSPWPWLDEDRQAELMAIEVSTGEVVASHPLDSENVHVAISPSGALIAVAGDTGDLAVLDVTALGTDSSDAIVGATQLASETLPSGMAFSGDERTLYLPGGDLSPVLLALAVDHGLSTSWSVDIDVHGTGLPTSRPTFRDGHIWIAADSPGTETRTFGLIGIPDTITEYADWASSLPTRTFSENECQQLLGGSCEDTLHSR